MLSLPGMIQHLLQCIGLRHDILQVHDRLFLFFPSLQLFSQQTILLRDPFLLVANTVNLCCDNLDLLVYLSLYITFYSRKAYCCEAESQPEMPQNAFFNTFACHADRQTQFV